MQQTGIPTTGTRAGDLARRAFDIGVSVSLMLFLLPLFLFIAAALALTPHAPVLHRDVRLGRHGRPFTMYKFSTMYAATHSKRQELLERHAHDAHPLNLKQDPRITRLGYTLRRTSLDEMPQFFNVLKGDMSLVGPRPLLPDDVHLVAARAPEWHSLRATVRPGLTGAWQVQSRCRPNASLDDMIAADSQYVRDRSWRLDLRLLVETLPAMLRGHGSV